MIGIDKIIDTIPESDLENKIYYEDIIYFMDGKKEQNFSLTIKKLINLSLGLFLPLMFVFSLLNNQKILYRTIFTSILELSIIISMLYLSLKKYPPYIKYYGYEMSRYYISKLAFFSVIIMFYGMDEGYYGRNYTVNFILATFCVTTLILLYYLTEKNLILKSLNEMFDYNFRVSKVLSILLKLSIGIVVLVFIFLQFYRINKWWLPIDFGKNITLTEGVDSILGILIGIPMLLGITLIPTYLFFNSNTYVKAKILIKYSEDFRNRYDYSETEWYG